MKTEKRALVIIDMQRGFYNANALITINKVIKQIKRAKKFGDTIFVVEYTPHSSYEITRPEVMKAIGSYPHSRIYKCRDNGSQEILAACDSYDSRPNVFRLCGVNTNACVKLTLIGLYNLSCRYPEPYNLEFVPEACNGHINDTIFQKFNNQYKAKTIGPIPTKRPVRYI